MTKTAKQLLEEPGRDYPDFKAPNYFESLRAYESEQRAREDLHDEVAYARVLARRGLKPEDRWPKTEDDPRRAAWRKTLWKDVEAVVREVGHTWNDAQTVERVQDLFVLFDRARAALLLLNEEANEVMDANARAGE